MPAVVPPACLVISAAYAPTTGSFGVTIDTAKSDVSNASYHDSTSLAGRSEYVSSLTGCSRMSCLNVSSLARPFSFQVARISSAQVVGVRSLVTSAGSRG